MNVSFRRTSSRCTYMQLALSLLGLVACTAVAARDLRVCADPNNLPFSNAAGEGFENRIVELLARDLGADVKYTWWAQRRGAIRNTLNAGDCDVIPGMASSSDMTGTTNPYYRSTYVFVSRKDRGLQTLTSLDDPRLRTLRIGVQLVGDDGANPPPAMSLARRGITANVRGYMVYGNYADKAPQAAIIRSVAHGDVDVAVVWGPTAGYFAARSGVPMVLTPISPWLDGPQSPMVFDISMGLRRDDRALRRELNRALMRNRKAIDEILDAYHVPRARVPALRTKLTSKPCGTRVSLLSAWLAERCPGDMSYQYTCFSSCPAHGYGEDVAVGLMAGVVERPANDIRSTCSPKRGAPRQRSVPRTTLRGVDRGWKILAGVQLFLATDRLHVSATPGDTEVRWRGSR